MGVVKYQVFRDDGVTSSVVGEPAGTSFSDTGLIALTSYTYIIFAVDAGGNISLGSDPIAVITLAVGAGGGGGGGGGGCFIATAAFGSPLEPQVELLRDFRDGYLLPFELGRKFVELYYRYSPPAAMAIGQNNELRALVQLLLWPLIALAWFLIEATVMVKLGICVGFAVTGWSVHRYLR